MTKKEAIKWANHFPRNDRLWFGVIKFNDEYIVYDSSHINRHPSLLNKIIYTTKEL